MCIYIGVKTTYLHESIDIVITMLSPCVLPGIAARVALWLKKAGYMIVFKQGHV